MTAPAAAPVLPAVADVLDRAADLLDERGWCTHVSETLDGRMCAQGAIRRALRDLLPGAEHALTRNDLAMVVRRQVRQHLTTRGVPANLGVTGWNDEQAADGVEVAASLRAAAVRARTAGGGS